MMVIGKKAVRTAKVVAMIVAHHGRPVVAWITSSVRIAMSESP